MTKPVPGRINANSSVFASGAKQPRAARETLDCFAPLAKTGDAFGSVGHGITVWHDGDCPLCRAEIALMRRLDTRGAIDFVDATEAGTDACPLDRSALLARFHASEDGKLLSGAAAFAAMWRAIPILRPLGLLARSRTVLWALEKAYLGFLRFRPTLQRLVRRRVPS